MSLSTEVNWCKLQSSCFWGTKPGYKQFDNDVYPRFGEHVVKEQDVNANLGKQPYDDIWSSTKKNSSVENAYGHWEKHKGDFPNLVNAKQYVDATHNFVNHPPEGTLIKIRENGDTLYYNPKTNTFAIKNKDGTPRTMYKPEKGLEYWDKQK